MTQSNCIFCDIVANIAPSWIIYQNNDVICFLPKEAVAYGHTVIATRSHFTDIYTMPNVLLQAVLVAAKKLAVHYRSRIGALGMNILHASGVSAQQSVLHFHIHLVPRLDNDGLDTWPHSLSLKYCASKKDSILKDLLLLED